VTAPLTPEQHAEVVRMGLRPVGEKWSELHQEYGDVASKRARDSLNALLALLADAEQRNEEMAQTVCEGAVPRDEASERIAREAA
jgi:hypothetical protein